MIASNSLALKRQLQTDLDRFIKLVKSKEDNYLKVMDLINRVIHNRVEIQNSLFIHDQINKYRNLISETKSNNNNICHDEQEIMAKYKSSFTSNEEIAMLLKRAANRILQIIYNTINQFSNKIATISADYSKFKSQVLKILADSNQVQPYQIIRYITDYSTNKLSKALERLDAITNRLQNGNIEQIYNEKVSLSQIKQTNLIDFDPLKNNCIKIREKSCPLKQEIKYAFFKRSIHERKAKKVLDILNEVMEINCQQFIESYINICQQENKEKLMKQLMQRNQQNGKFIAGFIQRKFRRKQQCSQTLLLESKLSILENKNENLPTKAQEQTKNNCFTARKSNLKLKENQYKESTITTQLIRKINRGEENKIRMMSSYKRKSEIKFQNPSKQKKILTFKTIEEDSTENEKQPIKKFNHQKENNENFPILGKRAVSVNHNYKMEYLESQNSSLKASKLIKLSDEIKNDRLQKSEMFPKKVMLQLKSSDLTSRILKMCDFNSRLF